MTKQDLHIVKTLLERTENLPDILHLRAAPIDYELTDKDKELLLDTYQKLDDILKEVAAFINVNFPGRQDYIQPWNDIDFDTKIGAIKITTTDREQIKSEWKKGIFDLKSLIKSLLNEVELNINKLKVISSDSNELLTKKKNYYLKEIIVGITVGLVVTIFGGIIVNRFSAPIPSESILKFHPDPMGNGYGITTIDVVNEKDLLHVNIPNKNDEQEFKVYIDYQNGSNKTINSVKSQVLYSKFGNESQTEIYGVLFAFGAETLKDKTTLGNLPEFWKLELLSARKINTHGTYCNEQYTNRYEYNEEVSINDLTAEGAVIKSLDTVGKNQDGDTGACSQGHVVVNFKITNMAE